MAMTGEEIRIRGLAVLRRELGRTGLIRFLQHFHSGQGDYVRDRAIHLQGLGLDGLRDQVRLRQKRRVKRAAEKKK